MERIFCNAENQSFDAESFQPGPHNMMIHLTDDPHTLDGWPATPDEHEWHIDRSKLVRLSRLTADSTTEQVQEAERGEPAGKKPINPARPPVHGDGGIDQEPFATWATNNRNADATNLEKFHDAAYDLAKDSVTRSQSAAELVQKASAAIAVLYSAVVGVVFSVTSNPLPVRGVLSPIFLGLAVVLATAYVAYLGPTPGRIPGPLAVLGLEPKSFERLNAFIKISNDLTNRRSYVLRASVVALGVGLACVVAPFVSFTNGGTSAPTVSTQPAYPPVPSGANADLEKVLYQAQVDEVSKARAASAHAEAQSQDRSQDYWIMGVGLVVGLGLVFGLPRVIRSVAAAEQHHPQWTPRQRDADISNVDDGSGERTRDSRR
jgi:hypothetical protein